MSKNLPRHNWDEPLDAKKLSAFMERIQDMADQEFGVDDEGDSALEVHATDRTRFQRSHFQPVPYGHRSEDNRKKAFEATVLNLKIAFSSFDTEDSIRKAHLDDERIKSLEKKS